MIQSYELEIIRKRRAARLFWLIVFVCSFFLYYFFQGYYPDVSLGMRRIFSESGSESASGSSDLIRSFGIINVRATPEGATIHLGSGSYTNNDKKMSDYGEYLMDVSHDGYLTNTIGFRIDREKPFFIEKVSLLPKPTYREIQGVTHAYPVTEDTYIMRTASGLIWSGATMTGRVNYSGSLEYIGGVHFQTSTGAIWWSTDKFIRSDQYIQDYVRTCPELKWVSGLFYCPRVGSILTEGHQYMTGVLDISHGLIARSGSITEISDGNIGSIWSVTGTIDLTKRVIIDGDLYIIQSGSLISTNTKKTTIRTNLDQISSVQSQNDEILILGTKGGKKYLIARHTGDPIDRDRVIELPDDLDMQHTIFHTIDGNLMIETPTSILFVYRGSTQLYWIVEGAIVSHRSVGALYRNGYDIWWADWSQ